LTFILWCSYILQQRQDGSIKRLKTRWTKLLRAVYASSITNRQGSIQATWIIENNRKPAKQRGILYDIRYWCYELNSFKFNTSYCIPYRPQENRPWFVIIPNHGLSIGCRWFLGHSYVGHWGWRFQNPILFYQGQSSQINWADNWGWSRYLLKAGEADADDFKTLKEQPNYRKADHRSRFDRSKIVAKERLIMVHKGEIRERWKWHLWHSGDRPLRNSLFLSYLVKNQGPIQSWSQC